MAKSNAVLNSVVFSEPGRWYPTLRCVNPTRILCSALGYYLLKEMLVNRYNQNSKWLENYVMCGRRRNKSIKSEKDKIVISPSSQFQIFGGLSH